MNLSLRTNELIRDFLIRYYEDENLRMPRIRIYSGIVAQIITGVLGVEGITFGRHILIRPGAFFRDSDGRLCLSKTLLVHEITHSIQYQRQGFCRFLFNYFREFVGGMRGRKKWDSISRMSAYLNISHEIEARDSASKFTGWFASTGTGYSCSKISK